MAFSGCLKKLSRFVALAYKADHFLAHGRRAGTQSLVGLAHGIDMPAERQEIHAGNCANQTRNRKELAVSLQWISG